MNIARQDMYNKSGFSRIIKDDLAQLIKACKYKKQLEGKSFLITGVNGLIATYLTLFLLEMNRSENTDIKVYALTRNYDRTAELFANYINDAHLIILNQDVCDPIELTERVDYVFHAAGAASAYAIKNNPVGIIRANTVGTMNVLEYAAKVNADKVLFPSTREIYGKVDGINRIKECDMGIMDPLSFRNCYPESKRVAEALLESYYRQYGVNYCVLRIAHVYGPTMKLENDGRVMADFIEAVVNRHDIVLNSDGSAIRAFCYITDLINGVMVALFHGETGEAYNLANETEPKTIRDIAETLLKMFPNRGCKLCQKVPDDDTKQGYVNYKITQLDTGKIEKLGWKPVVDLEQGMRKTVLHFIECE